MMNGVKSGGFSVGLRSLFYAGLVAVLTVSFVLAKPGSGKSTFSRTFPPAARAQTLSATETFPGVGVTLDPPPAGTQPGITADQAIKTAEIERVGAGSIGAQPILALLTDDNLGGHTALLVWDIRYTSAYVTALRAENPPVPCTNSEYDVLIDASAGKYIEIFS